jgi:hypothetical protein
MAAAPATVAALAAYVHAAAGDAYVDQCAAEAEEAITLKLDGRQVPPATVARAVLEYGAEQFHRRQSRNGIAGLDGNEFAPMRIARDPMKAAMVYLQPYLGPAVA